MIHQIMDVQHISTGKDPFDTGLQHLIYHRSFCLWIEQTLDTLNAAFEKLLDSLFRDTAWDVSSDISVLNTMLAQEGLKDDGSNFRR